jgi:hypothetical protein
MQLKDTVEPRGVLEITVYRDGQPIEQWRDENLIVNGAREIQAQRLAGEGEGRHVARIGFGEGSSPASPNDTGLTGAYTRDLVGHDYPATGEVRFHFELARSEANGKMIREFGLIAADGTLFSRKVRGVIEKYDEISLSGTWTIIY